MNYTIEQCYDLGVRVLKTILEPLYSNPKRAKMADTIFAGFDYELRITKNTVRKTTNLTEKDCLTHCTKALEKALKNKELSISIKVKATLMERLEKGLMNQEG